MATGPSLPSVSPFWSGIGLHPGAAIPSTTPWSFSSLYDPSSFGSGGAFAAQPIYDGSETGAPGGPPLIGANGTQVSTKDQSILPSGTWDFSNSPVDPALAYVTNPAAASTAISDAVAAGMSPADAIAMVTKGIGSAGTRSSSTGISAPPNLTAYQRSPAGSDPAVHAALMAQQTQNLITAPNGVVYDTDKSGNSYKTALGNSPVGGYAPAAWKAAGYSNKQAWLDAGGKTAPDLTPPAGNSGHQHGGSGDPSVTPLPNKPPVTPPAAGPPSGIGVFDRTVSFPPAGYRPGFDNEWQYFKTKLAAGGVVGYADGGPVGTSDQADPRVMLIADAEDALQRLMTGAGQAQDKVAIDRFVQSFGPSALDQLKANVAEGLSMRAGMPGSAGSAPPPSGSPGIMAGMGSPDSGQGRLLQGPGTGTSDSIPAIVDGTQPAALSTGEYVMPAAAVAGAGRGDPAAGAKMLQDLSTRLSDMHKATKKKKAA